jgi:hypothetical protein
MVRLLHRRVVLVGEEDAELAEVYLPNCSHAERVSRGVQIVEKLLRLNGVVNVYH